MSANNMEGKKQAHRRYFLSQIPTGINRTGRGKAAQGMQTGQGQGYAMTLHPIWHFHQTSVF